MPITVAQISPKHVESGAAATSSFALDAQPAAGSTVLVCAALYNSAGGSIASVTVGGQSANEDVVHGALTDVSIWRVNSFSGVSANVVLTFSEATANFVTAAAMEVRGLQSSPLNYPSFDQDTDLTTDNVVLTAASAPNGWPALFVGVVGFTSSGADNGVAVVQGTAVWTHQNSTADMGGMSAYAILTEPDSGELEWSRTNANGWYGAYVYYVGVPPGLAPRELLAIAENGQQVGIKLDEGAVPDSLLPGELAEWKDIDPTGRVQSVNGRTGAVALNDADVPAAIITESTTSRAMSNSDAGSYIRHTSGSAKSATYGTGLDVIGQEFHHRNVGANNLTLTASSTTLNPPAGGTLIVPPGGTVTVKQVGATEFDVFGTTTAA